MRDDEMDTHQIFSLIPRGKVTLLAAMLHLSPDLIRRWAREPLSDEHPTGTRVRPTLSTGSELF